MPAKYQDPESTVFVSNVEQRVTEEILWELFLQVVIKIWLLLSTEYISFCIRWFFFFYAFSWD